MAKLPTALDLSGPASFRSGRQYSSADMTAAGRGLAALGSDLSAIGAERKQQENTVDIARAEAAKTEGLMGVQNAFDVDPDYATYNDRAPKQTTDVVKKAASLIRDPQMRERWELSASTDAARVNDGIFDKGASAKRSAEVVALDNALETNRRIYVDPETPDELRTKAKADIDGTISSAQQSGLYDAVEADKRRKQYIEDADFNRAKLEIEKNPAKFIARGPVAKTIAAKAEQYGVDPNVAVGIAYIESGLNPNAKNPNSSAGGIYQFIDGTAAQYGLSNKFDVDQSADAGARFTRDNVNGLRKSLGREPSPGEAYLAHFSGFGVAEKLGRADPNTPAEQIFSPQAVRANASILRGKTAGEVRVWADKKMAKAIEASGGEMPDYVSSVSPERRADLSDYATRKYSEQQTQEAAQSTAMSNQAIDDFSLRIATGDTSLTQNEILSNSIIDNGQKATLINSLNSKMKEFGDTAAAIQAFASGGLTVDPYDAKGKETVDNVYSTATKSLAPEQVRPITEEIVRQTGVVPKQVLSGIRQGLTSNDPMQIEQAAQAAQRISTINPAALSRRDGGSEVQKIADDFGYFVNKLNMSPADAARRIQAANDPARAVERKAIDPAAKQFVKSLEDVDLASEFDTGVLGAAPSMGANPAQALGIQAEFMAIAEDQFYQANGDPEIAKNRAVEQMKRLYGPSSFGVEGNKFDMMGRSKSVLMKHPPEMYWPKDSGDGDPLQYAKTQLWQDVSGFDPEHQEGSIQLITTSETDAMVKRGEMPAYSVLWKDKNGVIQTLPGKFWRPEVGIVQKRTEQQEADERALMNERAMQKDADIKDGRDRAGSLDSFLGGGVN